jgi:putative membrane protein
MENAEHEPVGKTAMTTQTAGGVDVATRLAVDRTRLAHERTLMAWVRTATSLIAFGFSIYKFFEFDLKGQPSPNRLIGPRGFALTMIGIGLIALLLSTIEHRRSMHTMRAEFEHIPLSTAAVVAGLISVLGILAFIAIVARL